MSLTIYTCLHGAALPPNFNLTHNDPPPTHLPYLCKPCHHTLCLTTANNIGARLDPIIADIERRVKKGDEKVRWMDDPLRVEALQMAKRRVGELKRERKEKVEEVWEEWRGRWGVGSGPGGVLVSGGNRGGKGRTG